MKVSNIMSLVRVSRRMDSQYQQALM